MGQHLVVHLPLVARAGANLLIGSFRRRHVWPGEHLVDVVDQLRKRFRFAIARLRKLDAEVSTNVARIAAKDDDSISEKNRFLNVVGHKEYCLRGHRFLGPQLQKFAAQVLRREHVERGKRLIHEEHFGLDNKGARKADALLHATGELFGVSSFKSVQTDGIQHLHAACAALIRVDPPGLERRFDILKHGEPGEERKTLEDDRDIGLGAGDGFLVPVHLAGRGRGEAAQHAEHRGFPRT